MNKELSPSAQRVQDALFALNMSFQVVELPTSTRTAKDAAQTIGCKIEQIVKSLVFRAKQTGKPVLVLASGPNRINENLIGKLVEEHIEKASADFVRDQTGFVIGGVPPVGHDERIETYIDQDLLQHEELWAAAGTPNAVFQLNSSDLEKLTEGKIVSIQ